MKRRIRICMIIEIMVDTFEEFVTAHICNELLQNGGALRIGDAIEIDLGIMQILDRRNDRMGG